MNANITMTRTTDFTNTELCLESCDDTVSSLGSIDSFDDDSDTESTTSSSSSREDEILLGMGMRAKYGRSLISSSPDLLQDAARERKHKHKPKPALANARWDMAEATRSLNDLKVDASLSPKSKSMRKTKSLDDKDKEEDCDFSTDRWSASESQQESRLSRDLLQDGGRWSSSNQLKRASSHDSTPRIPRASAPDLSLKSIKRCSSDDPRVNARWSAKSLSPKPTPAPRSITRGRLSPRAKRDSAPMNLRRREGQLLDDNSSGEFNMNECYHSRRSASSVLDTLLASSTGEPKKKPLPSRGSLSRWNSSSSFKTITSVASVDQWSTKPNIPKRRRRSGEGKKKRTEGAKEEISKPKLNPHPVRLEPQLFHLAEPTLNADEPSEEDGSKTSSREGTTAKSEALQELMEEEEVELEDLEEEALDSFQTSFRYSMPPCMDCFETILEEASEDELGASSTPSAPRLRCDSVLLAPKRRTSEHSLGGAMDDSSLSMSMSLSTPSMQGSSCRRRDSGTDPLRHAATCPHRRRGSDELSSHSGMVGSTGPRLPCRRASIQENMRCESNCSLSSTDGSDGGGGDCSLHRRLAPQSPRTMGAAATRMMRRAWTPRKEQEKQCHPLLDEIHPLASPAKARPEANKNNFNCPAA